MQAPSEYDDDSKVWMWDYDGELMEMKVGERFRFKVVAVRFPESPKTAEELASLTRESGAAPRDGGDAAFAPMLVIADINEDGLGLCSWWEEKD
jgi:DNA-directed RNA polymerase III subunit RPC8